MFEAEVSFRINFFYEKLFLKYFSLVWNISYIRTETALIKETSDSLHSASSDNCFIPVSHLSRVDHFIYKDSEAMTYNSNIHDIKTIHLVRAR